MYKSLALVREAIADYTEALSHDPTYAAAYVNRGNLYALNDAQRSIDDYTAAIKLVRVCLLSVQCVGCVCACVIVSLSVPTYTHTHTHTHTPLDRL